MGILANQPYIDIAIKYWPEFTFYNELGRGSYGMVYKVKYVDEKKPQNFYALKIVELTDGMSNDEEKIFFNNCDCKNDNILSPIEIIDRNFIYKNKQIYQIGFFLPLMNGDLDELSKLAKDLDCDRKIDLSFQTSTKIFTGLNYLHKKNEAIHLDIKPGNILFNYIDPNSKTIYNDKNKLNIEIKISDFGLSCFLKNKKPLCNNNLAGTLSYIDPVGMYFGKNLSRFEFDIYSASLTLLEFINNIFIINKKLFVDYNIGKVRYDDDALKYYSSAYQDLKSKIENYEFKNEKLKKLVYLLMEQIEPFPYPKNIKDEKNIESIIIHINDSAYLTALSLKNVIYRKKTRYLLDNIKEINSL